MSDIRATLGVVVSIQGTQDNVSPRRHVYDHFHIWGSHELFYGDIGENRYVPEVGDLVVDHHTAGFVRVTSVDAGTSLFTTTPITPGYHFSDIADVLGVTDMGYERLYIDKTTSPHTAVLDQSIRISGSTASYCIVYNDSVLGPNSNSVSRIYHADGSFDTDRIPLERISQTSTGTLLLSKPTPFKMTADIQNSSVLTAVFYDDVGNVVYKKRVVAEDTGYIKEVTANFKVVEGIYLKTIYLDNTTPNIINRENNMLLDEMNVTAIVKYSDGSKKTLSITDPRIALFGSESFDSQAPEGTEITITVAYTLEDSETAIGTGGDNSFITREYIVKSVLVDPATTVDGLNQAAYDAGFADGTAPVPANATGYTPTQAIFYQAGYDAAFDAQAANLTPTITTTAINSVQEITVAPDLYFELEDSVIGDIILSTNVAVRLEYSTTPTVDNSWTEFSKTQKFTLATSHALVAVRGWGVTDLRFVNASGKDLKVYNTDKLINAGRFISNNHTILRMHVSPVAFSSVTNFNSFIVNTSILSIGNINTSSGQGFDWAFRSISLRTLGKIDTTSMGFTDTSIFKDNPFLTYYSTATITSIETFPGIAWVSNDPDVLPDLIPKTYPYAYEIGGATATNLNGDDLTSSINTTGTVDLTTVGDYSVTYNASFSGYSATPVTNTISVVDMDIPLLVLSVFPLNNGVPTTGSIMRTSFLEYKQKETDGSIRYEFLGPLTEPVRVMDYDILGSVIVPPFTQDRSVDLELAWIDHVPVYYDNDVLRSGDGVVGGVVTSPISLPLPVGYYKKPILYYERPNGTGTKFLNLMDTGAIKAKNDNISITDNNTVSDINGVIKNSSMTYNFTGVPQVYIPIEVTLKDPETDTVKLNGWSTVYTRDNGVSRIVSEKFTNTGVVEHIFDINQSIIHYIGINPWIPNSTGLLIVDYGSVTLTGIHYNNNAGDTSLYRGGEATIKKDDWLTGGVVSVDYTDILGNASNTFQILTGTSYYRRDRSMWVPGDPLFKSNVGPTFPLVN